MKNLLILTLLFVSTLAFAQIPKGVYTSEIIKDNTSTIHEIKADDSYIVYTVYMTSPADFKYTLGGFYSLENGVINISLEFNSNYKSDGLKKIEWPIEVSDSNLILKQKKPLVFTKLPKESQALDGKWLFATRGPDEGQERRGEKQARKTMKFLIDGHFQWIAYQTETFKFSGTGGGSFSSKDGQYLENITFFSRDNNRVGATLDFSYEVKDSDWHHKGKNSKGEPMYEIWSLRD